MAVELSVEDRENLTLVVMGILDSWQLTDEDIINLLGLEKETKPRHLGRLRHGTQLISEEIDQIERSKSIMGIQNALQQTFPLNHNMPNFWLRNRSKPLKGIPMVIMLEQGLNGMERVWRHLDCTRNWVD